MHLSPGTTSAFRRRVRSILVLLIAAVLLGYGGYSFSKREVEPDSRPEFVLDATKPFVIEFGRGSGLHGLDVVKVDETGLVQLSRVAGTGIESATLRLYDSDVKALVGLVSARGLTGMARTYSDPKVHDGTQWVLWIQQSPSEKAVYFNNAFPRQIQSFARDLDAMLRGAGLGNVRWNAVPTQEGRDQQAALWRRLED